MRTTQTTNHGNGTYTEKREYVAPYSFSGETLAGGPDGIHLGMRLGLAAAGLTDRERGLGTAWEFHLSANVSTWTFAGGYGRQSGAVGSADVSFGGWVAELGRRLDFVPMAWGVDMVALLALHGGPGAKITDLERGIFQEHGGWALRPGLRYTHMLDRLFDLDVVLHIDARYTYSEVLFGEEVRYRGPSLLAQLGFMY